MQKMFSSHKSDVIGVLCFGLVWILLIPLLRLLIVICKKYPRIVRLLIVVLILVNMFSNRMNSSVLSIALISCFLTEQFF